MTSSAILTTKVVVVQSMHQTILYFTSTVSIELALSTTQQMVVKVFAQFLTLHRHSVEQFTLSKTDTTKVEWTHQTVILMEVECS